MMRPPIGRLDRHVEHLARDELLQPLGHLSSVVVGVGLVHDGRERVDRLVVDEQVDAHELAT